MTWAFLREKFWGWKVAKEATKNLTVLTVEDVSVCLSICIFVYMYIYLYLSADTHTRVQSYVENRFEMISGRESH